MNDDCPEKRLMPQICADWQQRSLALNLPKTGKRRTIDQEAYMQGALTALRVAGLMDEARTNQIGFLVAVGRLNDYMTDHHKVYQAAALIGASL